MHCSLDMNSARGIGQKKKKKKVKRSNAETQSIIQTHTKTHEFVYWVNYTKISESVSPQGITLIFWQQMCVWIWKLAKFDDFLSPDL